MFQNLVLQNVCWRKRLRNSRKKRKNDSNIVFAAMQANHANNDSTIKRMDVDLDGVSKINSYERTFTLNKLKSSDRKKLRFVSCCAAECGMDCGNKCDEFRSCFVIMVDL